MHNVIQIAEISFEEESGQKYFFIFYLKKEREINIYLHQNMKTKLEFLSLEW